MSVQKIRCPKCRKEFTQELPDTPGKTMISCPSCDFTSSVSVRPSTRIPSAVMPTPQERLTRESGTSPGAPMPSPGGAPPPEEKSLPRPLPPPPGEPKVVTMKPLTRKQRERDLDREKKARKRETRARRKKGRTSRKDDDVIVGSPIEPAAPRTPVPPRFTVNMRMDAGKVQFQASSDGMTLTGTQRSPEVFIFKTNDKNRIKLEVIDPNVAVFRILTPDDVLIAFIYEKLSGEIRTLYLQQPDGNLLTMTGDISTGPGGYAFDLTVVNDSGERLGHCSGEGRAFQGRASFMGTFKDERVPIGALAALHLMGNTARSHR